MRHDTPRSPLFGPAGSVLLVLAMLAVWGGSTGAAGAQAFSNPHGELSMSCKECHTTEGWTPLLSPLPFEHADTGFDLDFGHRTVDCTSCHLELVFSNVGTACADCHLDPHLGELGFACDDCHATTSWDPRDDFELFHDATLFPLTGAHEFVDCIACHSENPPFEFQLTPTDCFTCHVDDYINADLDHVALGFPTTCESCHRTDAFTPATFGDGDFDHDVFFPLRGAHEVLDCSACHAGGFSGTPTDCAACHLDDYNATTDPNHAALGFPTMCEQCHSTTTWEGAVEVDHDAFFPLNGVHAVLDCQACHADGFDGTPTDCFACHAADYNATSDPNHQQAGFGTMCEDCHNESSWQDAAIDHDAFFPLTGAHAPLDCEACHADGFDGTPTDCESCHLDDYNATTDPNHQQAGFPTMCEECHTTATWEGAVTDHSFFPLTGAHAPLDCQACHAEGFDNTPTDCVGCHLDDYNDTDDPDHQEAGFPTMCEDCHNTTDWEDADFDHNAVFELTGAHRTLDCEACHSETFDGTPRDCAGCHLDDYNDTDDPDHQEAGFPTMCEDCHNTTDWEDAEIDHSFWELTGAHQPLDCQACHAEGFDNTPTECVGCHLDDYNSTDDPDHEAAGFPTTCEDCHNTSDWEDAEFDHDGMFFPIYSGRHAGEWDDCTDCHVDPGDFGVFECIFCHEHNQEDMDDEHDDVPGYSYESEACLSCHPDGEED